MEAKQERLQKILAAAGIASRRKAEELITTGRVSVNGHTITELGSKADPRQDEIRVDGKLLRGPERHVYLAMYKPKGVMTTVSDPEGRPTVMDLLKGVEERVFPVGRLDYMSEGLLLLTNDGDLMAELTRAGSHVAKTYMVKVSGKPNDEQIEKLRQGILLPPEPGLAGARGKRQPGVERRSFAVVTQPAAIQLAVDQENPWFEVTLTEGRNRQLRRMFEQIGHHIEKIKRIRYGSLTLDLESGEFRHLTPREVTQLRKSLTVPFKPRPLRPKARKTEAKHAASGPRRAKSGDTRRAGQRSERPRRLESARFVEGRRGKPSPQSDEAASARTSAARPAPPKREQRTTRGARSERGAAAQRFSRPRGPEFAREGAGEERRPAKQGFGAKPRTGGPRTNSGGKFTRSAAGGERRFGERGFGERRSGEHRSGEHRSEDTGKRRAFGEKAAGRERRTPRSEDRPKASTAGRKFSKGPGKPAGEKRSPRGARPAAPSKGGKYHGPKSGTSRPPAGDRNRRSPRPPRRSPGQR